MNKTERLLVIVLELQRRKLLTADGNRVTVRTVSPFGLAHDEQNGWLLVASCDLREDIRHFRVS